MCTVQLVLKTTCDKSPNDRSTFEQRTSSFKDHVLVFPTVVFEDMFDCSLCLESHIL